MTKEEERLPFRFDDGKNVFPVLSSATRTTWVKPSAWNGGSLDLPELGKHILFKRSEDGSWVTSWVYFSDQQAQWKLDIALLALTFLLFAGKMMIAISRMIEEGKIGWFLLYAIPMEVFVVDSIILFIWAGRIPKGTPDPKMFTWLVYLLIAMLVLTMVEALLINLGVIQRSWEGQ